MFGRKKSVRKTYDPLQYHPVLKCSICNGEQVAGFRNLQTGEFEEVMLITSEKELAGFLKQYGLNSISKEY